jgi:3-methyl-2-oxobutanoate hydroxymethyltransferase
MKNPTDMSAALAEGRPISMVTCYDAWSARIIAATKIDCVLVGDSAAMVMHGHDTTIPAEVETMALHVAAVRRGLPDRLVIADMPFLAHRRGLPDTMDAVSLLMRAGAQAVKIEGAGDTADTIRHIVDSGVPVMGHLGLTPQSIHQLGGYRVQGRGPEASARLLEGAGQLQSAGCFAVVLECVPAELAGELTSKLEVPTIGIGAGPHTSGQVLVLQDLLGMQPDFQPHFLRTYLDGFNLIRGALDSYHEDVVSGGFPSDRESYR